MLSKEWIIYGANGYTGRLIVRLAKKRGLQPILAGRSQEVETLAKEHHLKSKIFSINCSCFGKPRETHTISALMLRKASLYFIASSPAVICSGQIYPLI